MKTESALRVIVTGGSGFIGTNAIDYLIEKNINFINFDFTSPKKDKHKQYWKDIDIRDFDSLKDGIEEFQPTHILHLAAMTGMDIQDISFFDANTIGVENLINISRNIKSIRRIVFTSSLLVCRNGYIPQSETDYCPPNLYGESKVIGEKIVRSAEMHCEWAIVRPTSIWGEWFDYSYKAFFQTIDKNRYMHIGKEEFQKPASYVGNTVNVLMKLLLVENPKINGSTFYITDYPWYSTKGWANTIQKTLNTKPIKTAPLWLLRLIALTGDLIKGIFKIDPPLTTFRLNNMLTGGNYFIENTKEICGQLPYYLSESVYNTAKWMFEKNFIKHKPKKI